MIDESSESKVFRQDCDVLLYLGDGLPVRLSVLVIKERMDQEVSLKRHYSKRPNIHSLRELSLLIFKKLWCPVNNRACHLVSSLMLCRCSKIRDLERSFRVNDIFRLDVSVYDFLFMNEH